MVVPSGAQAHSVAAQVAQVQRAQHLVSQASQWPTRWAGHAALAQYARPQPSQAECPPALSMQGAHSVASQAAHETSGGGSDLHSLQANAGQDPHQAAPEKSAHSASQKNLPQVQVTEPWECALQTPNPHPAHKKIFLFTLHPLHSDLPHTSQQITLLHASQKKAGQLSHEIHTPSSACPPQSHLAQRSPAADTPAQCAKGL
jgi:hypothetical protein